MITLRCTQKLRKYLGVVPVDIPEPTTSVLGDWYANLVPTVAGDLILCVNEKSLLTIAIPVREADNLVPFICLRIANLLRMIGVDLKVIANEIRQSEQVQYGKTASQSILGSMNDFAWRYQTMAENAMCKADLSLSKAELKLSQMPFKALGFQSPFEVAVELLSKKRTHAT